MGKKNKRQNTHDNTKTAYIVVKTTICLNQPCSEDQSDSSTETNNDTDSAELPRPSLTKQQRRLLTNCNLCIAVQNIILASHEARSYLYDKPRLHVHVSCLVTRNNITIFGNNATDFTYLLDDLYMFHAEAYAIFLSLLRLTNIGERKSRGILRRAIDKAIRDPYNTSKKEKDSPDNFKFKKIVQSNIYVTRLQWNKKTCYKNSAPCRICMYLMKLFGIRACYYTCKDIDTNDNIPIDNINVMEMNKMTFLDIGNVMCSTGARNILAGT